MLDKSCKEEVTSLQHWESITTEDDYTIIDSVDTKNYYLIVYQTNNNEIVVCNHWKYQSTIFASSYLMISDDEGRDLHDFRPNNNPGLKSNGTIYPIKKTDSEYINIELGYALDSCGYNM